MYDFVEKQEKYQYFWLKRVPYLQIQAIICFAVSLAQIFQAEM